MPSRPKPQPGPSDPRGGGRWASGLRDVAPYLGLGTSIAVTVLAGLGGGYWLDGRFQTRPLFLLLGGTLGLATGLYQFFRTVARLQKR